MSKNNDKNENAKLLAAYESITRLERRFMALEEQLEVCMRFLRYWQKHRGELPPVS